ncbi:MAG: putative holliday junction resolvase [Microgenomates group bacterium Gr01-1014_7]|nr:MAG: putative holliday junction resolvase [Microgenomates group bacterium Gr01-1014_7]
MKYLGVDFGLRRVGLAISEGSIASPFKTIEVKDFSDAVEKIFQLVEKMGFSKIVIGLPEGKMGQTVRGFINALKKKGLDIVGADETLSSKQAILDMIAQNAPREKRKVTDAAAAAIILQNWLDSL